MGRPGTPSATTRMGFGGWILLKLKVNQQKKFSREVAAGERVQ